jgi:hypothetical protein
MVSRRLAEHLQACLHAAACADRNSVTLSPQHRLLQRQVPAAPIIGCVYGPVVVPFTWVVDCLLHLLVPLIEMSTASGQMSIRQHSPIAQFMPSGPTPPCRCTVKTAPPRVSSAATERRRMCSLMKSPTHPPAQAAPPTCSRNYCTVISTLAADSWHRLAGVWALREMRHQHRICRMVWYGGERGYGVERAHLQSLSRVCPESVQRISIHHISRDI